MEPRSSVKFAAVAGATAGGLALVMLGPAALGVAGTKLLSLAAGLAAGVAFATALLAFAEERAARQTSPARLLLGLLPLLPVALLAIAIGAGQLVWALAVQEVAPEDAPLRTLRALGRLDATTLEALALAALLPTAVAITRATRGALAPSRRLAVAALVLGGAYAVVALPERHVGMTAIGALGAGIVYLAGVSLGDVLVKETGPRAAVPLHAVLGRFVLPLIVGVFLAQKLGPVVAGVAAALWVAWFVTVSILFKRILLGWLPAEFSIAEGELPPWFDPSAQERLEADLARHGLRRVALGLFRTGAPAGGNVLGLAAGDRPTVALLVHPAPPAEGAPPPAPTVVISTWFDGGRRVLTTGMAMHGLTWVSRSPDVVYEARPDAPLDELFARHAADVDALAALAGPPTGPSTAERALAFERDHWPTFLTTLRAAPAPWLLACQWWFTAPRPVRLRGPLPA